MIHLHTDIGHDPDDVIALSYLLWRSDFVPSVVSITPGFKEQVLIVDGIYKAFGLNRPEIFRSTDTTKTYQSGKDVQKLIAYGKDDSSELLTKIDSNASLVIGPAKNLKLKCHRMTFQGGYSPNSVKPLDKFKDKRSVMSFNPNGAKKEFVELRDSKEIDIKYYIGKNVCHGFFKKDIDSSIRFPPIIQNYFNSLSPDKKMHDFLAAKLFVNTDLGIWSQEMPVFTNNGEMTTVSTNQRIYTLLGIK